MMYRIGKNVQVGMLAIGFAALLSVAHAALDPDVSDFDASTTAAAADGVEQLNKAAEQATQCQKAIAEVNEALEKGRYERAETLKKKKDAICEQTYSAEKENLPKPETKEETVPAATNPMGADARDSENYYQEGFAGRQRNTKEMTYVTFEEAKDKNLPYGWTESTRTSDFGPRTSVPTANGGFSSSDHKGEDYSIGGGLTEGTDIYSNQNGKVVYAGEKGAYGKTVIVEDDNGNQTQYSHLSDINVNVGDKVTTGYQIGDAGATGNSTAAHLHYGEIANGSYVNPATSSGIKNYDVASVNAWADNSVASGGYSATAGSGGSTGSGTGGSGVSANSGLGSDLISSLTGSGSSSGFESLIQQLFGGGSSGGSGGSSETASSGTSGSSSDGTAASELVVKTVTEVAANGDTTRTTTYADGRTETLTVKATASTSEQLSALLVSVLGEEKAVSVMESIQALCGSNLSTSADADMLKVSQCQSSSV